ncbi:MAG: SIMPL domain-containing protein [Flavobacteriia bacterium]|nr:SIMPL domain-containing protein [Flavobacteriia bacterium]
MKNHIHSIILSLTVIIAALIIGNAYKNKSTGNTTISVTGLGEENFTSDLIVWKAGFSSTAMDLKQASEDLRNKREKIKKYLIGKGASNDELVFNSVSIQKLYNNSYDNMGNIQSSYFSGFSLNQTLRIESKEVDKIEKISREITELINQDIELDSYSPDYYYTNLRALKLRMIENATKDAKTRAEKIAINAGSSLGKLKNASMGVIQITARNSSEDYSWGGSFNTTSKLKTASITIRLEYDVD